MEVIRAGKEWKERIISFANEVFGSDVSDGGFAALIPDVYGAWGECDGNHLLVLEEGRIQALLLTEPISFLCGQKRLDGIGVGTVSVSAEARGRGYMQLLLKTVREWMEEEGFAFAVLAGQRQRYAYWGYEPTGVKVCAEISPGNVKHALGAAGPGTGAKEALELVPMEESGPDTQKAWELFNALPIHTLRKRENFTVHLRVGRSRPFVIRSGGEFKGYLSAVFHKGKVVVSELEVTDEAIFPAVLELFFRTQAPKGFEILLPLYRRERLDLIERISDGFHIRTDHSYYIADLEKVLAFSMEVKRRTCGLGDGKWAFSTQEGTYRCEVKNGSIRVSREETSREKGMQADGMPTDGGEAVFTRDYGEMIRILFGPAAALWQEVPAPAGWLPFPLYLSEVDAV